MPTRRLGQRQARVLEQHCPSSVATVEVHTRRVTARSERYHWTSANVSIVIKRATNLPSAPNHAGMVAKAGAKAEAREAKVEAEAEVRML